MNRLCPTALLVVTALAGCTTVGPDYHLPDKAAMQRPAAQAGFANVDGKLTSQQPAAPRWWQLYHDPVLNQLVEQARAANTDLRAATANLQKAMAVATEVNAEAGPHAAVSASAERARVSGQSMLLEEPLPVTNLGDEGIRVAYQLDLFGKLRRGEEAAEANTEAVSAARDLASITVTAETVRSYLQICSANHGYQVLQQQYGLQQKQVELTQRLARAGRLTATDVLRAKAQADSVQAGLPVYQAQRDAARYRLAMLLGKTPGEALPPAALACTQEPQLAQAIPVGDGAALLARRPDVKQAERRLAQSSAMIGVATAELYPSITLGASAGFTGFVEDLGKRSTQRFGFGPLISWTIPDSGSRARVTAARADNAAALAHFDGVVLNALREVETSLSLYGKDLQRLTLLRSARDSARDAAAQNRRLYQAGRAPYLSSLDADRTMVSSDLAVASAESQLAQDQVNLFLALGGGWEEQARSGKAE
ncbi:MULTISPECIES: efflux transporter outer membrane subunit [Aquitalea]|uniref:efflux transporter outer membrane subunit n=1 Tax=Aquitalea TaxID=407217 RepID=UPI00135AE29F|nr:MULTISPECIES: efflux transporter outer membrane subunit [Aquitalea]